MKTHYTILGIGENASPSEIKKAYRALALKHHPDRGGNEETFRALKQIYECLIAPSKREQYDLNLKKKREEKIKQTLVRNSGLETKIASQEIKVAKIDIRQAKIKWK